MDQNDGAQSKVIQPQTDHSPDYVSYPKIDPLDVTAPAETWTAAPMASPSGNAAVKPPVPSDLKAEHPIPCATTMPAESNPYVSSLPVPPSSSKNRVESMKDMLEKFGKKAAETTKKMEEFAGGVWQHLKTSPSFADAAVGRIAQGTKALAEGGYEKIFQQTFETIPLEHLRKSYACYLSTSAGPVMGMLYLSTEKLAFCSDNPLSYKAGDTTQWSYYKVIIPLQHIKAVNPSISKANPSEKFIQIISVDNHDFWFLGFVNYESAVKHLLGILQQNA